MKAADISDDAMLMAVFASGGTDCSNWAMRWDVATHFPGVPDKVVLAKARKLIKRGLMAGCGCGCRGDWHVKGDQPYCCAPGENQ